jgi:hypothetical protein
MTMLSCLKKEKVGYVASHRLDMKETGEEKCPENKQKKSGVLYGKWKTKTDYKLKKNNGAAGFYSPHNSLKSIWKK